MPASLARDVRVAVVGLGYVGLPLAVALARRHDVLGFDLDGARVAELANSIDRTEEVGSAALAASCVRFTDQVEDIAGRAVYVVTVPTPVDIHNVPDLGAVRAACRIVGRAMPEGAIVVLESTVYPGVTEEICGPEIESASGLVRGRDFFLGYSPERINLGDAEHGVEHVTKIVAGEDSRTARALSELYGGVVGGGGGGGGYLSPAT